MWTRKGGVPSASDATREVSPDAHVPSRPVNVTSLSGEEIIVEVPTANDAEVSTLANAVHIKNGTPVNMLHFFDQTKKTHMSIYQPIGDASDFLYTIRERTEVDVLMDLKESSSFLKAHPKWAELTHLTNADVVPGMDLNADVVAENADLSLLSPEELHYRRQYIIDRKEKDNNFITGLRVRDLTRETLPDLSPLVHLQILYCSKTFVQKLPDLSTLVNLKELGCTNNRLEALPDLSKLTHLEKLKCSKNKLTQLPDLSKLICLKMLLCASNELTALPDLSKLVHLTTLYCHTNQLTSLPDLSTLTELNLLNCANNNLSVDVKTELRSHPPCNNLIIEKDGEEV